MDRDELMRPSSQMDIYLYDLCLSARAIVDILTPAPQPVAAPAALTELREPAAAPEPEPAPAQTAPKPKTRDEILAAEQAFVSEPAPEPLTARATFKGYGTGSTPSASSGAAPVPSGDHAARRRVAKQPGT